MKNIFLKYLLLFIMLFPVALKAQDMADTRLSKISFYNYNANKPKPDMVYEFIYDAAGTIKKIIYYQDGKLFSVTDNYKFNINNKIISYDSKNVTGHVPRHHYIDYDESGRREKRRETVFRDGRTMDGNITYYHYSNSGITAITERHTFAGKIYDTATFHTDKDGHIQKAGMNKFHPNPLYLTGSNGLDIDEFEEWPVAEYFAEQPIVVEPTFGTTTTEYKYDKNGLLSSYNWKYVTEKEKAVQSTGKTVYAYIHINKKP